MRKCSSCKQEKGWDCFYKNTNPKFNGFSYECKDCHRKRIRGRYQNDPKYRKSVRERARKVYRENPAKEHEKRRGYYKKNMVEIFSLLGNRCALCPISDRRLLQIDHINGGGHKHRKAHKYAWRKITGDVLDSLKAGRKEYRLLCANCNWLDGIERGYRKSIW